MNRFDYNRSFMTRHIIYNKLYPLSSHLAALLINDEVNKVKPEATLKSKLFILLTLKRTKRSDPCD